MGSEMCIRDSARDAQAPNPDARRKVSGSAYKISSQHAYHHGTLLLDADLGRMRLLRRTSGAKITSRAVDSVSSPVANLRATFPERAAQLTPQAVFEAIRGAFAAHYGEAHTTLVDERGVCFAVVRCKRAADRLKYGLRRELGCALGERRAQIGDR